MNLATNTSVPPSQKNVIYGLSCACHPEKGLRYIGQTRMGSGVRLSGHKADALRDRPVPIARWIRKHGPESLIIRVLEVVDSPELLNVAEMDWISCLRESGFVLLNIGNGGDSPYRGEKRPDHAQRMSGKGNPMYGVERGELMAYARSFRGHPSDATKALWSKNRKGSGNANAKLTEDDVRQIRQDYRPGWGSLTRMSEKYGVTLRTIKLIVTGETWTEVA